MSTEANDSFAMKDFASKHTPPWQLGHFIDPEDAIKPFGPDKVVLMRKARKLTPAEIRLAAINDETQIKAIMKEDYSYLKQFFAGRKNFQDVTTATLAPYFGLERLNEGTSPFGIALSNESLGSVGQIFGNLMGKRVFPIMLAIGGLGYLNWEIENFTGVNIRDSGLELVKGTHIASARLRDSTGLTRFAKRQSELMPGLEHHMGELPVLGFFNPTDSERDLREWYQSGQEPVRKGRWWSLGNCVTPDTPILVNFSESKRADQVNIGDLLLTHTGKLKPVKRIIIRDMRDDEWTPQVQLHTFTVPTTTTDNHPYLAVKKRDAHLLHA